MSTGLLVSCGEVGCSRTVFLPRRKKGVVGVPFEIAPLGAGWSYRDSKTGWRCPDH